MLYSWVNGNQKNSTHIVLIHFPFGGATHGGYRTLNVTRSVLPQWASAMYGALSVARRFSFFNARNLRCLVMAWRFSCPPFPGGDLLVFFDSDQLGGAQQGQ